MVTSLFLAFREGLEAALVIGIILVYLHQTGRKDLTKFVFYGAVLGLVVSVAGGFIGFSEARGLGEEGGEIFENVMRLAASGLIIYFVVWIAGQAGAVSEKVRNQINTHTSALGLVALSFLSVFREGIELCIMIFTKISEDASDVALGIGLGLVLAVIFAYGVFRSSLKLNLKFVFKALGLVLIYLGSEMLAEGLIGLTHLGEEPFEAIFMVAYMVPALYFFLRKEVSSHRKNR